MGENGIILGFTLLFSPLLSFPTFVSPSLRPLSPPTPGPSPSPGSLHGDFFVLQTRSDSSSIGRTLRAAGRVPSAII